MPLDDFYLLMQIAFVVVVLAGGLFAINQAWELLNRVLGRDK